MKVRVLSRAPTFHLEHDKPLGDAEGFVVSGLGRIHFGKHEDRLTGVAGRMLRSITCQPKRYVVKLIARTEALACTSIRVTNSDRVTLGDSDAPIGLERLADASYRLADRDAGFVEEICGHLTEQPPLSFFCENWWNQESTKKITNFSFNKDLSIDGQGRKTLQLVPRSLSEIGVRGWFGLERHLLRWPNGLLALLFAPFAALDLPLDPFAILGHLFLTGAPSPRVDEETWLTSIRELSSTDLAKRLGITDLQARRIKTGKVGAARLREHAKRDHEQQKKDRRPRLRRARAVFTSRLAIDRVGCIYPKAA